MTAVERVQDSELAHWRERAETAEAALARVRRAVMNQSSTVDLTQAILDALDGDGEEARDG